MNKTLLIIPILFAAITCVVGAENYSLGEYGWAISDAFFVGLLLGITSGAALSSIGRSVS